MEHVTDQRHAIILGLGDSGLAMAAWCARMGWTVTVLDSREQPPRLSDLQSRVPQARFRSGAFDAAVLDTQTVHAVFKSPGLSPAQVEPLWSAAMQRNLWCGTELSLFAQALQDLAQERGYRPQVLAITGTNGKTTVSALTASLLQRSGMDVGLAGNIGPTLLDTLSQRLDCNLPQAWLLELSSFQLNDTQGFAPSAATVLNLSQDHLDWHGDMAAYAVAKGRIFGPSTLRVLRRNDPALAAWMPTSNNAPVKRGEASVVPAPEFITFGSDLPQRPGDYGLEVVNGMTWLVRALPADETLKREKGEEEEVFLQRLMPADALRIRGRHNALNALAALALAVSTGQALAPMLYGLREYAGEPHRVESVAIVADVEYFDDSKGTNVGATVAAIEGLGSERRVWVILGGEGKGQDFGPLAAPVARHAAGVALIGRDAPLLAQALAGTGVTLSTCDDLPAAVAWCHERAQAGDAVLLSPACASFDMFQNYGHRAEIFVQAVRDIAASEGVA
ncbi:MAG: UDP-N-acetylmuramoyl-L-alanine--D-glutamate ligase [Alphaproteobacteria bacterium]|nr:UDP-N-acetylmuramoyl-L-alanine--D-glutamate ligase [Alphaproteobacteria bacterium]MDI9329902.1 UDP-N-acetylmuramoyl-L-alanine--D-glutamate ligase [Alphaproteobacteria bacterium]